MGPATPVIAAGAVPLACSEKPQGHPAAAARISGGGTGNPNAPVAYVKVPGTDIGLTTGAATAFTVGTAAEVPLAKLPTQPVVSGRSTGGEKPLGQL